MRRDPFLCCRNLQMLRIQEGMSPRNCTKYLRELWWSKCGPKALESLAGCLGPGDGRPGPKSNSCKVTAELDPGVFEPSISPGGEKSWETYPLCPHTCSAAEPETRGSSAWGFPGGCRDSLPRRGVHHKPGGPQPGRGSAAWCRAAGCQCLFHLSPQQQPGLSFVVFPSTLDPESFQQSLPFSAT